MALLLTKSDVIQVLDMKSTIEFVENAFADLYLGNAIMPQRTPITVSEHNGVALFMPSYIKSMGALGTKIFNVYKNNA
jgi:ornithine cyclodeaminase/alanine dehydrogenase-like protein (mu-crystallin family)